MPTRGIDRDRFDLTIVDRSLRSAKRICVIAAVTALTLSAFDLANIRSAEDAARFIGEYRQSAVDLPDRIRTTIDSMLSTPASPFAIVAIPRGEAAAISPPAIVADTADAAPAAEPAAELQLDTVEFAAEPPPVMTELEPEPLIAAEFSPAERLRLEGDKYAKAERCLADAIYFEARAEPVRGQMAVAQVVINRTFSGFYPNDICGVVYQNADRRSCQFSFACDGKSKIVDEHDAWARANRIAKQVLDGEIYVPEVAKSTHFHAVYVHPSWVREMKKVASYGVHNFYRPIAWGDGLEEPGVSVGKKSN